MDSVENNQKDWEDSPDNIKKLKTKDAATWQKLIRIADPILVSYAFKFGIQNRADAEDRAQDTWLKVSENIGSFELRPNGSLIGWIVTFADHVIKDWFDKQKAKKRDGIACELDDNIPAIEKSHLYQFEELLIAYRALWTRKPKCAQVVELFIFCDLPFHEVASRLGISEGAAKARFYQGAIPELKIILEEIAEKEGEHIGAKVKLSGLYGSLCLLARYLNDYGI
jgi:RNA polymerase sigma factor (sigma-70 family)